MSRQNTSGQALQQAIGMIGDGAPATVAAEFGFKSGAMAIRQWFQRGVPYEHVIRLSELTGWVVTPHQLAPEIYPHSDDGLPDYLRSGRAA